ncbi:hypothetical protein CBS147353_10733 [Aspergillus niger]|nr:hypothetical protein CBS147353_10733 [Aspergillus niger]
MMAITFRANLDAAYYNQLDSNYSAARAPRFENEQFADQPSDAANPALSQRLRHLIRLGVLTRQGRYYTNISFTFDLLSLNSRIAHPVPRTVNKADL